MIEFDCDEVKRQLNRMAEALPDDKVDVWIRWNDSPGRKVVNYTAYVSNRGSLPSACCQDECLAIAVDETLKAAGDRSGLAEITAKRLNIEKARVELAKLESELDPFVMAIDKAKADASNPT